MVDAELFFVAMQCNAMHQHRGISASVKFKYAVNKSWGISPGNRLSQSLYSTVPSFISRKLACREFTTVSLKEREVMTSIGLFTRGITCSWTTWLFVVKMGKGRMGQGGESGDGSWKVRGCADDDNDNNTCIRPSPLHGLIPRPHRARKQDTAQHHVT